MNGKKVKKKWPDFAKKYNIEDNDVLFLVGEDVNILRIKKIYDLISSHV